MREIIIDTETTGLNFRAGDRIIEVACLELINHVQTGKKLQFYCSTKKAINEGANKIHGLTNEFLNNHQTFEEQAKQFLDFIKNDTLIIHNAEFDLGFINNELTLSKLPTIKNKVVDTVILARKKLNTRIANLDYLCRRFSIDLSKRSLHGALLDCQLLAEVYLELLGGKQTSFGLNSSNKTSNLKNSAKKTRNQNSLKKVVVSESEVYSHKKFVKSIKNAIWNKLDY